MKELHFISGRILKDWTLTFHSGYSLDLSEVRGPDEEIETLHWNTVTVQRIERDFAAGVAAQHRNQLAHGDTDLWQPPRLIFHELTR
jgi:hypothetical protein